MAIILDGKTLSQRIRDGLKERFENQHSAGRGVPHLAVVQVGDNLPSTVYIRAKGKACEELGFRFDHIRLPESISMAELQGQLVALNEDDDVHGLLVQSPLPAHLDEVMVQQMVSPQKDVDCFHPENVGLLYIGRGRFAPCTAGGIIELLLAYGIETSGANTVIIGRSVIVGRPLALMMMLKARGGDATVTVCHSRTRDLPGICRRADIVIPAIGIPEYVRGDWVREGVVVVDVGINRVPDTSRKSGYRLVGDAAFAEIEGKARAIAPVPGGVGPMTVAILMSNLMRAAGYDMSDWEVPRMNPLQ